MTDFFNEITELNKPHVHIKNKDNVNKLISEIKKGGVDKLQIVSDFDRTITKQHENGKEHHTSFGLFEQCPSVPKAYKDEAQALTDKYLPIELDPVMPIDEKKKYMEIWWSLSEKLLRNIEISEAQIEEICKTEGPALRDGTVELFTKCSTLQIPVLVFSAGLGDTVVAVLKHNNVLLPNVKVISNFFNLDNNKIMGFKGPLINVFNKNEYALKGTSYHDMVKGRENVILMGDSIGDAGMAKGMDHVNSVLKIGFLYDQVKENLPNYMEAFDIVLVDDQTMEIPAAIFGLLN